MHLSEIWHHLFVVCAQQYRWFQIQKVRQSKFLSSGFYEVVQDLEVVRRMGTCRSLTSDLMFATTVYGLTNKAYSKCSGPNDVGEQHVNDVEQETFDVPEEVVGINPCSRQSDEDVRETRNITYRTNTTNLREKVDSGLQRERDNYQTSSGEQRMDHGRRRYRHTESPTNYYRHTVSFNTMPIYYCLWYRESRVWSSRRWVYKNMTLELCCSILEEDADDMTTPQERIAERVAEIHTTPALEALPAIGTGPAKNMVEGAHVTVGRGLLHFTMTDICKHYPPSTKDIIEGVIGVSIDRSFIS